MGDLNEIFSSRQHVSMIILNLFWLLFLVKISHLIKEKELKYVKRCTATLQKVQEQIVRCIKNQPHFQKL